MFQEKSGNPGANTGSFVFLVYFSPLFRWAAVPLHLQKISWPIEKKHEFLWEGDNILSQAKDH
jgi:hypothetical protein